MYPELTLIVWSVISMRNLNVTSVSQDTDLIPPGIAKNVEVMDATSAHLMEHPVRFVPKGTI